MVVTKLSDTTAKITFTGNANNHENVSGNVDNVNNIIITFENAAFAGSPNISALATRTKNDIAIEYTFTPPEFIWTYSSVDSESFYETGAGKFTVRVNFLKIDVRNAEFITIPDDGNGRSYYEVNTTHYSVANVPAGLTVKLGKGNFENADKDMFFVILEGTATSHASGNDVNNLTITLNGSILKDSPDISSVASRTKNDIKITYDKMAIVLVDEFLFIEDRGGVAATGSIRNDPGDMERLGSSTTVPDGYEIRLFRNTAASFELTSSVNNDDAFTANTHYEVISGTVPAGLTLRLVKDGATRIRLFLDGQATSHGPSNSTSFVVRFKQAMFATGTDMNNIAGKEMR
ncbi:hypothetical protein AWC38_SpisGene25562, partial [Stylophora pistillata]